MKCPGRQDRPRETVCTTSPPVELLNGKVLLGRVMLDKRINVEQ